MYYVRCTYYDVSTSIKKYNFRMITQIKALLRFKVVLLPPIVRKTCFCDRGDTDSVKVNEWVHDLTFGLGSSLFAMTSVVGYIYRNIVSPNVGPVLGLGLSQNYI